MNQIRLKRRTSTVLLLIVLCCLSPTVTEIHANSSDSWNNLFDFYSLFFDYNAGLTAFPLLQIPSGGRYEAMGTAFLAMADDSGFFDANPAGSSTLGLSELSFAHNSWIADTAIESVYYTHRRNNLGLGAFGKFLYVPFSEYDSWGETINSVYYTEGLAVFNASYNFRQGFYFRGISLGANVKMVFRHIPEVIAPGQSAFAVLGDFGALTRFNFLKFYDARDRNFAVGAVVRNLSPPLNEPVPSEAAIGLAYRPLRPLALAIDLTYPFSFFADAPAMSWHISAGLDVTVTRFLSFQSGFRHSGGPRFSLGTAINLDSLRVNLNYTLGLDNQLHKPMDRFSVSASLNLGDSGRFDRQLKIDEYYLEGLEAYARGNYQAALRFFEAALALDPSFEPATENIAIIIQTLALQEELARLNRVLED